MNASMAVSDRIARYQPKKKPNSAKKVMRVTNILVFHLVGIADSVGLVLVFHLEPCQVSVSELQRLGGIATHDLCEHFAFGSEDIGKVVVVHCVAFLGSPARPVWGAEAPRRYQYKSSVA